MQNDIILLSITLYLIGILCIIIVLNMIQYFSKKKYKNEIQNLDIEKNEVIDAPIMTELSKVEGYKSKSIKEKYKVWQKELDDIKKNLNTSINDTILEADFAIEEKNYNEYIQKKINAEIKLLEVKEQKQKLLNEIQEITLSEERNRSRITELKTEFRDIIHTFNSNRSSYSPIDDVISMQIETVEKRFQDFEIDMEKEDYVSANKLVSLIDKLVKHLRTVIEEVPPAIAMEEMIIPKRLDEMVVLYNNMVKNGYQLDYLNIEYNVNEINKKLSDIMARIRILNLEDVLFELKTILEYTDSVFNDFEREKIARGEYEEAITLFKSKIKKINDVMNKLYGKVIDSKYNYKLSEDQLKSLDNLSDELGLLDTDFSNLFDATRTSSFPYTRLNKELEALVIKLSKVEEKIDVYIQSIGNMQEDEKRAREQLEDMNLLLEMSKSKIREYKLPIVPDSYFIELKEGIEAIREVNKELDKKPISIDVLNTRVDTARDLIFKFNNTSNELIKTASLAEHAIVYANRYRIKKPYVNEGLNKAEFLFMKGEYKKSLELTLNTIDLLEPGIYQKILNLYEKDSK